MVRCSCAGTGKANGNEGGFISTLERPRARVKMKPGVNELDRFVLRSIGFRGQCMLVLDLILRWLGSFRVKLLLLSGRSESRVLPSNRLTT